METYENFAAESARRSILRPAMGPSPWGLPEKFSVCGEFYRFSKAGSGKSKLVGMSVLEDSNGTKLLILDFYCYAYILPDGVCLVWREVRHDLLRKIVFDCFSLASLTRIFFARSVAGRIRRQHLMVGPLPKTEHFEILSVLKAGVHKVPISHDWSRFEETLVLASHAADTDKQSRAIFAFDWKNRSVEVFPQDWFNNGAYDFGYQWITRVSKCVDGTIVGDGIRIGKFQLDESNRQLKCWLS